MPVVNMDHIQKREAALKADLAKVADGADAPKQRALGKKLRRAQRKRRKLAVEIERRTAKSKKKEVAE